MLGRTRHLAPPQMLANVAFQARHLGAPGPRALACRYIGPIGCLGLTNARNLTPDGTPWRSGCTWLAAQRQSVNAPRRGMVGIVLHPARQLIVARAILGRVHVALKEHVAHQQPLIEVLDQAVSLAPLAVFL